MQVRVLLMDSGCLALADAEPDHILPAHRLRSTWQVVRSDVVVCDHGPSFLLPLLRLPKSPAFVDVWHGVPFKALAATDFELFSRYAAVFAPSPWMREHCYLANTPLKSRQVRVTGYAVTDFLMAGDYDRAKLAEEFQLPSKVGPFVLLAPTWKHDAQDSSSEILDFTSEETFVILQDWASRNQCYVIVRMHLNSEMSGLMGDRGRVLVRDVAGFPNTYRLLALVDALVTDWSSIAADYLPLDRPMLFLNESPRFARPFLLSPEDRAGAVVNEFSDLLLALEEALESSEAFVDRYQERIVELKRKAYGSTLDGQCCSRYLAALTEIGRHE